MKSVEGSLPLNHRQQVRHHTSCHQQCSGKIESASIPSSVIHKYSESDRTGNAAHLGWSQRNSETQGTSMVRQTVTPVRQYVSDAGAPTTLSSSNVRFALKVDMEISSDLMDLLSTYSWRDVEAREYLAWRSRHKLNARIWKCIHANVHVIQLKTELQRKFARWQTSMNRKNKFSEFQETDGTDKFRSWRRDDRREWWSQASDRYSFQ